MAETTSIEWTDATWNPILARRGATGKTGWHCTHVSEGCRNCHAESINKRLGTQLEYKGGHEKNIDIYLDEKALLAPLRWKRPKMVFVCSMTDAFADFVHDEWLDKMFAVAALCPQHTFQWLTKRPARARDYLSGFNCDGARRLNIAAAGRLMEDGDNACDYVSNAPWPLPNVWFGVSAEDQKSADERIPVLLDTPAAVRWLSAEPLLGGMDLDKPFRSALEQHRGFAGTYHPLDGTWFPAIGNVDEEHRNRQEGLPRLDWIVTGGESGSKARPAHPDWFRQIRDQCAAAKVPYLHKQNGSWTSVYDRDRDDPDWRRCAEIEQSRPGQWFNLAGGQGFHGERVLRMVRTTKKAGGRALDLVEHNGFPK
jgi:protein gp37